MQIIELIEIELLYRPLLNLLIGIYNTIGFDNIGLAIIWLAIVTRVILLPISLLERSRKPKEELILKELAKLRRSYGNNPSLLREQQRALLKKYSFRKWPKIVSLTFQGIILLILYQVFIYGVNINQIVDRLYYWVTIPVEINTIFIGIDVAKPSFLLSFLTAFVLAANIWLHQKAKQNSLQKSDLFYTIGFPIITFVFLWLLPATKAIYILTSILFSDSLDIFRTFRQSTKEQNIEITNRQQQKAESKKASLPKLKDRFY